MRPATKSRFFARGRTPASSQSRYFAHAAHASAPEPPCADADSAVLPELPAAAGAGGASTDCLPACPKCGLPLRHRTGRHGPFIGCSGFPSCRHTGRYGAGEPPPTDGSSATAKPRSSRSSLCVRVEMESEASVRVWCSQAEPQQQWLRALLARLTHMPTLDTGPRADWLAQDSAEAAAAPATKGAVVAAADEVAGDAAAADGDVAAKAEEAEEGGRGEAAEEDADAEEEAGEEWEAVPAKPDRSLVGPAPKLLSAAALARASEETRARHDERP